MAKYKVLKKFKDKEKQLIYEVGEIVDITKERAKEIDKKLKGYIEEIKEETKKEAKKDPKKGD